MSSTWFIAAAGKGIGLGLVSSLLSRPSTTVIATTRDGKPTDGLAALTPAAGSRLIVLPLEVSTPNGAREAVDILTRDHNIEQVDVVWANAGIVEDDVSLATVDIDSLTRTFNINTLGPIRLLQATLHLLQRAKQPKFVITSSAVGSVELANKNTFTHPGYGPSKAAINSLARRANYEFKDVAVIALHPGLVDTDMGGPLARFLDRAAITVEESVKGVLAVVDGTTKETADKLHNYDQTVLPW